MTNVQKMNATVVVLLKGPYIWFCQQKGKRVLLTLRH